MQGLGPKAAEKLKRRLADLRAAAAISELVVSRPYELDGARDHQMAMNLCDGTRIVFSANHSNPPTLKSGRVDWTKVNRIKIMDVENYETPPK